MATRNPPLDEIAAFVAVAEDGSFTRAAERLGSTKSNVGKAVQRLEARLGTQLLQRSTRVVRLSEEGKIYLGAARMALDALAEAERALGARRAEPAGRLRVNLPAGLGRTVVLPSLTSFCARHPRVTFELGFSDRFAEAIAGDWDLVVRIGHLEDSAITARKLCTLRRILCASPDYLTRRGAPSSLRDLRDHDAVLFRGPDGRLRHWMFADGEEQVLELSPTPVLTLADGQALIDAAVCGLGIVQLYDKPAHAALAGGSLVQILPALASDGPPVHALIPAGRTMPAKTRVFLDHLVTAFA